MIPGVGIIGTNCLARTLIPILRGQGFKVEAVWSHLLETAEDFASEFNIPYYSDKVEDILLHKDVGLVFIMSPPHMHSHVAVQALGIGKHVVCDVPPSLTQQGVIKMIQASEYYPFLTSTLCYTLRYLPAFVEMKKAIDNGFIGNITVCEARIHCGGLLKDHYDWMCERNMGGGLLNNIGSHIIDILVYLTGKKACKVHGIMHTYVKNVDFVKSTAIRDITSDDFCTFQMELEGDAFATVTLNSHLPGKFLQEVLICGTKGHLVVRGRALYGQNSDTLKEKVMYLDSDELTHTTSFANKRFTVGEDAILENNGYSNIIPRLFLKSMERMIVELRKSFSDRKDDAVVKDNVAATFQDGQYVQATIDAICHSSKFKEWADVVYSEERRCLSVSDTS